MSKFHLKFFLVTALLAQVACADKPTKPTQSVNPLSDTHWQLDKIEYMDDTIITPDDRSKYNLEFDATGRVSIKADCNRLNGSYTYNSPSGLEFGALMSTRAACPPGSLYDTLVKDLPFVRSFVIKDGNLYLALMADGGIYHFSPITTK